MAKIENKLIVSEILKQIEIIRVEHEMLNQEKTTALRDKVFQILESLCTVLYYPCEQEENRGFHIIRHVNGEEKEFVYINTAKPVEMQVFAAAHELGHIWKVTDKIKAKGPELKEEFEASSELGEAVVSRFAAELLMPKEIFKQVLDSKLNEDGQPPKKISIAKMLAIITYLMNEFLTPYEAVVKRINEVGRIDDDAREGLLKISPDVLKEVIEGNPYKILGVITRKKEMGDMREKLDIAEEKSIRSVTYCDKYRELFGMGIRDKKMDEELIQLKKPEE